MERVAAALSRVGLAEEWFEHKGEFTTYEEALRPLAPRLVAAE